MTLLKVDRIETYIGQYHILQGVSFEVKQGEVTVLLGRNGAGKTTTLRSLMGLNPISTGSITFKGESIHHLPTYEIARKGIGYVPEDQGVFPDLTIEENIRLAMQKSDDATLERRDWILNLFPDLKTFWKKPSGLLSGGQKQMLAIARACVNDNELLLIDEPSKGLAPIMVEKVMNVLQEMKDRVTVVLVEQNFYMASTIGDGYYIIDDGRTVHSGQMAELKVNESLKKEYLGIA
ncbi:MULTISPECIES: ABC transporter ATP-binding protein [Brevibacillus]|uniref:ABC transporter ATP-binding protein n=1 Tax=Brevibacillus invocatus TaxID=173959 RepID=A0A3M8C9F1_9BACL|nr:MULTISPECIES: ABC transporter ATP-binding protein [Brevibacillus]MCM3081248.1 ABC transporter ATP-binding protein [Brevibacillus invocatus]MCM3431591.1 ABC transporter ATP-binding protein [Brevibacillus invocatus]MDH4616708.1 ABC transporter ATP-binding protein [Brevibacillus sp. AY1]RNB72298.1 ABC transporter ATP-binding protein [Brevibacillus invocatus]